MEFLPERGENIGGRRKIRRSAGGHKQFGEEWDEGVDMVIEVG